MTENEFFNECLKMKGAYLDYPFGDGIAVFKVKGKVFAQSFRLKGVDTVTLNCSREGGELYRAAFDGIVVRGYHCPPVQQPYFNSLPLNGVSDETLIEMIEHSYRTVTARLPKYVQRDLFGESEI